MNKFIMKEKKLTLEDVVKLGGDESDFNLLTSKSTKFGKTTTDFKKTELEDFHKKLGFKPPTPPVKKEVQKIAKVATKNKKDETSNAESEKKEKVKKKGKKKKKESKVKTGTQIKLEIKEEPKPIAVKIEPIKSSINNATEEQIAKFDKIIKMSESSENLPTKTLLQENKGSWYSSSVLDQMKGIKDISLSMEKRKALKSYADSLLDNEIECYKKYKRKGNSEWMKTVVTSGTISDKIAAYTLLLDASAIHNIPCLQSLLHLVKKKGTREAMLGMDKLAELLIANVLPENRRLSYLHQQPFAQLLKLAGKTKTKIDLQAKLIYWASEDRFKSIYSQFVSRLSEMLQDINDTLKVRAMRTVLLLLSSRPEQEDVLLKMLVNKFGDPKFKLASKALHMLHTLVNTHPAMQGVVAREVRDLLLRANVHERCQYYCICFLSTLILSHEQSEVADFLIEIYLAFYKAFSKKKHTNDKILSALLTGVNRAYPFASTSNENIVSEMDSLYKTVHLSSISTAVQSLMLLFQLLSSRDMLNDRYYNALYGILLSPKLSITVTKHAMFLNLLFRSLKADELDNRCFSFIKRLLQSCALHSVPYTSASLVLVCEVFSSNQSIARLFNKTTTVKDDTAAASDDEEEHYVDVDEDVASKQDETPTVRSSWTHRELEDSNKDSSTGDYDALNRVPLYANADKSMLWELHTLHRHYHPTVALFAENVTKSANEQHQTNESDPLVDFTLMKFLDKFVYRNPKAQPKTESNTFSRRRKAKFTNKDVAANSKEFLKKKNFRPEEVFLQRYFTNRSESVEVATVKNEDVSDVESVSDEEFERYLSTKKGQMNLMEGVKIKHGKTVDDDDSADEEEDAEMSDLDDEEVDFGEMEDEDPFAESAGAFVDADDDVVSTAPKLAKSSKSKRTKKKTFDADDFGSMLEETASQGLNLGGSHATVGSDKLTVKQMKWEKKQEERDIISRKRAFKRGAKKGKKNFNGAKKKKRF